jgi:hypothetical protein
MIFSPTRIVLGVAIVVSLVFAWYASDRRWGDHVSDRLLYGIPWGTLVIVGINIVFYFGVQGCLRNFDDPVVLPFVSWSYFYPVGMLTSGIAHGSANHIIGNMAGTIVLAPIAEHARGHHPPETQDDPPGESIEDIDAPLGGGYLDRPWLRAVIYCRPEVLILCRTRSAYDLGGKQDSRSHETSSP